MSHFRDEFLDELKHKGYNYQDVNEIFRQKILEPVVVETILKWLPKLYREHVGTADILTRSLMSAREPFDPSLLIDLFENSDLHYYLKQAMGLALSYGRTPDISSWLKDQLLNKEFGTERYGLIDGLYAKGGFKDLREYMDFLKKIFDKYHGEVVLKLFKKYGNSEDFEFLEQKAQTADPKLAKQIRKVIEKKRTK